MATKKKSFEEKLFSITYAFAKRISRSDKKAKHLAKQTVKDFKKTSVLFQEDNEDD